MMDINLPHRRFNPLTRQWVLVSPHRTQRPWLGQVEKSPPQNLPAYDPTCYLCPGNERAGGKRNPQYTSTFVFDNDFQALLLPPSPDGVSSGISNENRGQPGDLLVSQPEYGICRVVCFSPRHDLSIPEMSQPEVETVIRTWTEQTLDLESREWIEYVQVFENKGALMGASNPHPHSQIWATSLIPEEPAHELESQASYYHSHGSCLLCDIVKIERQQGERIVEANPYFTVLVPFWAVWPFETLLISNRHRTSLADLDDEEVAGLAEIMQRLTSRYDNLFEVPFPYSMGFHQRPRRRSGRSPSSPALLPRKEKGEEQAAPQEQPSGAAWHLHAHYYPPLLRSATVRKFMVGYEMLAMPQRDLTPEMAAERLRRSSDVHYKQLNHEK